MMRILFAVTLVLSSVNALIIPTTGGSKGKASRNPLSKAKRNSKKGEKYGLNADISSDWLDKYIVDSEVKICRLNPPPIDRPLEPLCCAVCLAPSPSEIAPPLPLIAACAGAMEAERREGVRRSRMCPPGDSRRWLLDALTGLFIRRKQETTNMFLCSSRSVRAAV